MHKKQYFINTNHKKHKENEIVLIPKFFNGSSLYALRIPKNSTYSCCFKPLLYTLYVSPVHL